MSDTILTKKPKIRYRTGATLISTLTAAAIIMIALIGTSNFRYYVTMDARKAAAQTKAARIALVLCENWRGLQGSLTYNPIAYLGSDITVVSDKGPGQPDDFTLLGSYKIVMDEKENDAEGTNYYVTLAWKDLQPGLRALNVIVTWAQRGQAGFENTDKSYTLTIYCLT